jgi:hypothetical protein
VIRKATLSAFIAIAFGFLSVVYLPTPFLWMGLAYCGLLAWLAIAAGSETVRAIFFNLGFVFLALAAAEGYLAYKQKSSHHYEGSYAERHLYRTSSRILGTVPRKNTVLDSRKYFWGELVYDVTYSIDANGLRVAPPVTTGSGERCILFFGGSFMFGEGVEDDAITPYRVGQRLEGRYRIFNFGYHGYGPHQMLSAFESGLAKSIADCDARYVIHLALVSHVRRSAGLALWDLEGPRYVLAANGVERDGSLFENYGLPLPVIRFLSKSRLFKAVMTRLYKTVDDEDIELYTAIVEESRNVVADLYPAARFHVILWNFDKGKVNQDVFEKLVVGMENRNLDVTTMSEILLDVDQEQGKNKYHIPYDGHPTALFHELLSAYIVKDIMGE